MTQSNFFEGSWNQMFDLVFVKIKFKMQWNKSPHVSHVYSFILVFIFHIKSIILFNGHANKIILQHFAIACNNLYIIWNGEHYLFVFLFLLCIKCALPSIRLLDFYGPFEHWMMAKMDSKLVSHLQRYQICKNALNINILTKTNPWDFNFSFTTVLNDRQYYDLAKNVAHKF